jgi:hypothetical protein
MEPDTPQQTMRSGIGTILINSRREHIRVEHFATNGANCPAVHDATELNNRTTSINETTCGKRWIPSQWHAPCGIRSRAE